MSDELGFLKLNNQLQKRLTSFETKVAKLAQSNGINCVMWITHIDKQDNLRSFMTGNSIMCKIAQKYEAKMKKKLEKEYRKMIVEMAKAEAAELAKS